MTQVEIKKMAVSAEFIETLKANPNVFQDNPELLELIDLSDNRGTASLLEKQNQMLKKRLELFHRNQLELIDVARENEHISDSFSPILCQLIGFKNLSEFASEFPAALRNSFDIDEVSIKTEQAAAKRPNDHIGYQDALRRLINHRAVCDNRWPSNIMKLFFSDEIKSAALIPMKAQANSKQIIGIIALGSNNLEKYSNDLGTVHLDRLGLMAGICVNRLQPSNV